jgi:hypothetical protein
MAQDEDALAAETHEVVGVGEDGRDLAVVALGHPPGNRLGVEVRRRLVDDDADPWDLELLRDPGRDPGAFEVLLVGPHDDHEGVGENEREKRLLVEARMGVDEQDIQPDVADEIADAGRQPLGVVTLAQDAGDLAGLHARRNEEEPPAVPQPDTAGDVHRDVPDRHVVPEVVVERGVDVVAVEPEQDVDAGRLDVGVDHADAQPALGEDRREVRGRVRLARSTSKRVHAQDRRHVPSQCRAAETLTLPQRPLAAIRIAA